ncbi:phage repressor protein/antirepressor Ant [Liquorilactobacillus mali]|uniref:phage repressor protein/antirepressor Ant n=2 Tax=Liquorilactobacillus mali TaxID=1618 RepID=UPI0002491D92|nr:phage repressor protein/antirepressor Ant [Liquorilactobacillus mali]EJF02149.1 anti-repressor protein [Liquorilactobacillus mali KCTC 3596 = DSM 20444]QFQ74544.1 phage repressor protein/antirepressor Ant [Liquorilactobacillus mali]
MNQLKHFTNRNIDLPIKVNSDNSIEFDAEQAAIGLGIFLEKQGVKYVRWERVRKYLNSPQVEKGDFITEPQFYKLAIKANNETAEKFQDWVTGEVLPSIRKHGAYMTPETLQETLAQPENMIQILTALKDEQEAHKKLQQENDKMKPHAILGAVVENSVNSISVKALATILKEKGINIGQNRLFQWLRENGYLISRYGHSRNYPTQRSMDMGLFELKPNPIVHNSGEMETRYTPLVTGKGQKYFINKFFNGKVLEA